jgi:hypothetical protein
MDKGQKREQERKSWLVVGYFCGVYPLDQIVFPVITDNSGKWFLPSQKEKNIKKLCKEWNDKRKGMLGGYWFHKLQIPIPYKDYHILVSGDKDRKPREYWVKAWRVSDCIEKAFTL